MFKQRVFLAVLLSGLLTTSFGVRAYAMRGQITKATGIAFSSDYPTSARLEIERALETPGTVFVKGHFINWISTLYFRGDTSSLNQMIKRLSQCLGTTLSIKFDEVGQGYDWFIVHDAQSNHFWITVDMRSQSIILKELSIPDIRSNSNLR
ncbi:MAG: hypothetical protein ACK5PB_23460 [Pirellula sp.]|jgi:hypothetical protein